MPTQLTIATVVGWSHFLGYHMLAMGSTVKKSGKAHIPYACMLWPACGTKNKLLAGPQRFCPLCDYAQTSSDTSALFFPLGTTSPADRFPLPNLNDSVHLLVVLKIKKVVTTIITSDVLV